jgi:hypothetical protein
VNGEWKPQKLTGPEKDFDSPVHHSGFTPFESPSAPAAAAGTVLLPAVGAALGLGQPPLAVELLLARLENEIVPALHAAQRPVPRGARTGFSRRKKLFDQSQ